MSLIQSRLALQFPQALERVTEELKKEGFGILSQIDVQAALREKIGKDIPAYRILGACNPGLAYGRSPPIPTSAASCPATCWCGRTDRARWPWCSPIPCS
nr:DUF302 domain-containing protein [Ramlibacter montanisoli]